MDGSAIGIICVILMAYAFDFVNGFHDAANTIATIVKTGVLTPRKAVLWSAFFNFISFMFFNLIVAKIIGNGLIDPSIIDAKLIFSSLFGAISWGLITWYFGLPSSSSHALIGGLAGAAITRGGFGTLKLAGFTNIAIGMFIVPVLGILAGLAFSMIFKYLFRNKNIQKTNRIFKALQLLSSALLCLAHGGNDAQKTMGIIAGLLFSVSWLHGSFYIPFWLIISCNLMIALGTFFGGWRIVNTMGEKITQLNPQLACAAETGAATIIFAATNLGFPLSTTQMVTGSIAGVGISRGFRGTQWPMMRIIFISWLLTIPASGLIASVVSLLF